MKSVELYNSTLLKTCQAKSRGIQKYFSALFSHVFHTSGAQDGHCLLLLIINQIVNLTKKLQGLLLVLSTCSCNHLTFIMHYLWQQLRIMQQCISRIQANYLRYGRELQILPVIIGAICNLRPEVKEWQIMTTPK